MAERLSPEETNTMHLQKLTRAVDKKKPFQAALEGFGLNAGRVTLKDNQETNFNICGIFVQAADSFVGFIYIPFRCFLLALKGKTPTDEILRPLIKNNSTQKNFLFD